MSIDDQATLITPLDKFVIDPALALKRQLDGSIIVLGSRGPLPIDTTLRSRQFATNNNYYSYCFPKSSYCFGVPGIQITNNFLFGDKDTMSFSRSTLNSNNIAQFLIRYNTTSRYYDGRESSRGTMFNMYWIDPKTQMISALPVAHGPFKNGWLSIGPWSKDVYSRTLMQSYASVDGDVADASSLFYFHVENGQILALASIHDGTPCFAGVDWIGAPDNQPRVISMLNRTLPDALNSLIPWIYKKSPYMKLYTEMTAAPTPASAAKCCSLIDGYNPSQMCVDEDSCAPQVCQDLALTVTSSSTGPSYSPTCHNLLATKYCPTNTNSDVCDEFCENEGTNCDLIYQGYCKTLTEEQARKDPNCGCFMDVFNEDYYKNFFLDLRKKVAFNQTIPAYPGCFYPDCALSKAKDFVSKQQTCPNIQQCLIVNEINNDGTISGDINVDSSTDCTFIQPADKCQGVTCGANQKCDLADGKCKCSPGYTGTDCSVIDKCFNIRCGVGQLCDPMDGQCKLPDKCANINCPSGTACDSKDGQCKPVDKCAGIACGIGQHCNVDTGKCIGLCDGITCPSDQTCDIIDGKCKISDKCATVNCPIGTKCNADTGQCSELPKKKINTALYIGLGVLGFIILVLILRSIFSSKK